MHSARSTARSHQPSLSARAASHAALLAERRTKRLTALVKLLPEIETLATDAKNGGLGLIGYFLDMAVLEARRERDVLSDTSDSP